MGNTPQRIVGRHIDVRSLVGPAIPRRDYATHGVDRYPAKMVPHLARYAIGLVSNEGDTVLDPFCGCGTVQVESLIMGRNSAGCDINPVAVALAKGKSAIYDTRRFRQLAEEIVTAACDQQDVIAEYPDWLNYWFTSATLRKLLAIRIAIECRANSLGARQRDVLRAALIISVRKCSRADPRSPKPFISKRARVRRRGKHFDANRIFVEVANSLADASDDLFSRRKKLATTLTYRRDARKPLRLHREKQVNAVVTSPPYLSAQDYFRSSKLELAVAGMWTRGIVSALGGSIIGSGRGRLDPAPKGGFCPSAGAGRLRQLAKCNPRGALVVAKYLTDMRDVLRGLYKMLPRKGRCCLIVGDSTMSGLTLPVHKWFVEIASHVGFVQVRHEIDTIRNRRLPPQRERHTSVIVREHLLFFRKG